MEAIENKEAEAPQKTYEPTEATIGVIWECKKCGAGAHNVMMRIVQALIAGARVRVMCPNPDCGEGLELSVNNVLVLPAVRQEPMLAGPNHQERKILQALRGKMP